jgi:hypothetical protein
MIRDSIHKMTECRQEEGRILPFPEGPIIVNNMKPTEPTVPTPTTNKTSGQVPSSKYGGLLLPTYQAVFTPNHISWAINVKTKSFREAAKGLTNPPPQEQSDSDTVNTINSCITSSMKTVRETELETWKENARLTQQLKESKEHYQSTIKQMQAEYKRQKQENKIQQEQNQSVITQHLAELKEENRINKEENRINKEEHRINNAKFKKPMSLFTALTTKKDETTNFKNDSDESATKSNTTDRASV